MRIAVRKGMTGAPRILRRILSGHLPGFERGAAHDNPDTPLGRQVRIYREVRTILLVLLATFLSTLLRMWIGKKFGLTPTYITFLPVVLYSATWGGTAAGLWATFFSILAGEWLYRHGSSFGVSGPPNRALMAIFLVMSGGISVVAGSIRSYAGRARRQEEEALRAQERYLDENRSLNEMTMRLAAIVESSTDAIIGKDPRGTITSWNHGAEKIFGYKAEEMIGQSVKRLLPPGNEGEEDEILAEIQQGRAVERPNAIRVTKDGRCIHTFLSVSPLLNGSGEVIGAAKIARDITATLDMERQLRQSQKMDAIGKLTGGVAHDFNNLLGIVIGSLDLLKDKVENDTEAHASWKLAMGAALRGADLTKRLLGFSSVEQLTATRIELSVSIRNIMELARQLLGPEIKVVLNMGEVPTVMVDAGGLEAALLNLAINARDAMPLGGDLSVVTCVRTLDSSLSKQLHTSMKEGSYVCISVSDSGTGMSQEVLDRAFEPFFTTKPRGRGTGLGLSMVYGFARQSQGAVHIHSELAHGTTVTIYLPFAEQPSRQEPLTECGPEEEVKRVGATVLLVDDEAGLVEIATRYLQQLGYTTLTANDGPSALRLLESTEAVDVLVTDVVMGGGMDGMELAEQVHAARPAIRIIYSSGFPADALSNRKLPLDNSHVLQKPYRLAELAEVIQRSCMDS
jgi:PAS domain S-box-containing protein